MEITVSKDVTRNYSNRWHVTLLIDGKLYHSAFRHPTALIDVAVEETADRLRQSGCEVRVV